MAKSVPRRADPAPTSLADIRDGARVMLEQALKRACAAQDSPPAENCDAESRAVAALEKAVYDAATRKAQRVVPIRRAYADALRATAGALGAQVGPYPEDVLGVMYLAGRKTSDEVVAEDAAALSGAAASDPRETIRRLFVRTLLRAYSEYARNRAVALETARELEISCFNATVR